MFKNKEYGIVNQLYESINTYQFTNTKRGRMCVGNHQDYNMTK